jgi:hypothetical protein
MHTTNVVAVTEAVTEAGAIVLWRKEGAVNLAALTSRWLDQGLDPKLLPELPTPVQALRLAVQEQGSKRRLVRPIKGGFAIVNEQEVGGQLDYQVECSVKITNGRPDFSTLGQTSQEVTGAFDRVLTEVSIDSMSAWLVDLATSKLHAVSLREGGGVYFVPFAQVATWRKMVAAIEGASAYKLYEIPALSSDSAVEAILDAVINEAKAEADAMAAELADPESTLGKRAMNTRITRCNAALAKLAAYDTLLGGKLDAIKDQVGDLQVGWSEACLAADIEEDAK